MLGFAKKSEDKKSKKERRKAVNRINLKYTRTEPQRQALLE